MSVSTIVDRLSERIFGSALAVKVAQDLQEDQLAQRRAWAAELAALDEAELVSIRETYQPARATALADVRRCQAALEAARASLLVVERARSVEAYEADRARDRLRRALSTSASPLLATCVRELRAERIATYALADHVVELGIDQKWREQWSNRESLARRIAAIDAAIDVVTALVFEPLDQAGLEARLSELRASLPDVESRPTKYGGFDPREGA